MQHAYRGGLPVVSTWIHAEEVILSRSRDRVEHGVDGLVGALVRPVGDIGWRGPEVPRRETKKMQRDFKLPM